MADKDTTNDTDSIDEHADEKIAGTITPDAAETEMPQDGESSAMDALRDALANAASDTPDTDALQARIDELEEEKGQMHDKALRAVAEVENIRRRTEREKQETAKFAVTGFARDMISVFENLSRANASISQESRDASKEVSNLAMGVEMTLKELEQNLGKHNIKRIDPMGQPFDHNMHQAMTKIETTDQDEGTVVQVLQAAYMIHDRLLAPALVAVATAPKDAASSDTASDGPQHVDTQA